MARDAAEVSYHRRGFFLRRNEQGLHRLEWRLDDRLHLLQGARRRPRRAAHLDMVGPRCARQAAGHEGPWCLADACRRTSKSGRELAGLAAMGASRGARASRVKATNAGLRASADRRDVFRPFSAKRLRRRSINLVSSGTKFLRGYWCNDSAALPSIPRRRAKIPLAPRRGFCLAATIQRRPPAQFDSLPVTRA